MPIFGDMNVVPGFRKQRLREHLVDLVVFRQKYSQRTGRRLQVRVRVVLVW